MPFQNCLRFEQGAIFYEIWCDACVYSHYDLYTTTATTHCVNNFGGNSFALLHVCCSVHIDIAGSDACPFVSFLLPHFDDSFSVAIVSGLVECSV